MLLKNTKLKFQVEVVPQFEKKAMMWSEKAISQLNSNIKDAIAGSKLMFKKWEAYPN